MFGKRIFGDSPSVSAKKTSPQRNISPDMKKVGGLIREARLAAGLTQERLAEKAEIAPRVLQKIEAGHITILVTTLVRLRRAIGCAYEDVLPD